MPKYEFECNQCKENFDITLSITERSSANIVCPKCESKDVAQKFSNFNIIIKSSNNDCPNRSSCGSGCCRNFK